MYDEMKKFASSLSLVAWVALVPLLAACNEFFEPEADNVLPESSYIDKESEMYRGYLGICTRMQEVGDQAIYLTDTRCNYLETTGNAPVELQNLCRYEPTDGNSYADPTGYYAVVVACNDFLSKMDEFVERMDGALSDSAKVHIPRLVSCTLRHKVWAYTMLGRIYGEAYWFDTPVTELSSLDDVTKFEHLDMKGISDRCIELLDNGIECCGQLVPANLTMDWTYWVDPVNGNDDYDYWKYMTPPWLPMRAELASWRTAYEDEASARADWQWVRDNVLGFLTDALVKGSDWYSCSMQNVVAYAQIFCTEQVYREQQIMGAVFYDYQNGQTNRLVQYFCPEYPSTDCYYLKPSEAALDIYGESDLRGGTQELMCRTIAGQLAFSKYYYTRLNNKGYLRTKIFEIEPTIPLYRSHELHFLLAEAENHLGHWDAARTLLNTGILNRFPGGSSTLPTDSIDGDRAWDERYADWFAPSGGYGDIGIVGCCRGTEYDLPALADGASAEEQFDFAFDEERIRTYDIALATEFMKEYIGEGKSYSYLVKMAERYDDSDIIFDLIKRKYDASLQSKVKQSLLSKRFIDWNL